MANHVIILNKSSSGGESSGLNLIEISPDDDFTLNNVSGAQSIPGMSFDVKAGKRYTAIGLLLAGGSIGSATRPLFSFDTVDNNLKFESLDVTGFNAANAPINLMANATEVRSLTIQFGIEEVTVDHTITMQMQQTTTGEWDTYLRKGSFILIKEA